MYFENQVLIYPERMKKEENGFRDLGPRMLRNVIIAIDILLWRNHTSHVQYICVLVFYMWNNVDALNVWGVAITKLVHTFLNLGW